MLTPENINAALEKCRPHAPTDYIIITHGATQWEPGGDFKLGYGISGGCNESRGTGSTLDDAVADFCAKNPLPGEWRPVIQLPPFGRLVETVRMDGDGLYMADTKHLHVMHTTWYDKTRPVDEPPTHWREIQYPEAAK